MGWLSNFLDKPRGNDIEALRFWHGIREIELAQGRGQFNHSASVYEAMLKPYRVLESRGLTFSEIGQLIQQGLVGKREREIFESACDCGSFRDSIIEGDNFPLDMLISKEEYEAQSEAERIAFHLELRAESAQLGR